jgi:hypothetical protein
MKNGAKLEKWGKILALKKITELLIYFRIYRQSELPWPYKQQGGE